LIDKLPEDKIPNMAKVFPTIYRSNGGYGVGLDVSIVALAYRTRTSSNLPFLGFPCGSAYKGKVSVPSISGTHGLNLVVVAAALETGKPYQEAQLSN